MRAGSVVPALFPGGGDLVYAPGGSAGWVEPAVFLLLGSGVIVAMLRYGRSLTYAAACVTGRSAAIRCWACGRAE